MLYIISAPSGTGKSTLIKKLLKRKNLISIGQSISYTTRSMRKGEKNKKNYYFVSLKKFQNMIEKKRFLEYAKVFGNYYGTEKKKIQNICRIYKNVILDIDWKGEKQIRKSNWKMKSIFILPPSKKELIFRLKKRDRDKKKTIIFRTNTISKEIKNYLLYDYFIVNDDLDKTVQKIESIIVAENLKMKRNRKFCISLIEKIFSEKIFKI
ncbi:guanylate kinase [bacterium endosymbiont of Pedicinus badii]|uniref:guanylate kinase n=1 Tax=bacterium endosymbiont of Pedicinus badii TaxID=1719126 RepID=UPI0009BA9EC2|nr:guanylate kinase [bacterium endosymbiont of Pedicinus badii]